MRLLVEKHTFAFVGISFASVSLSAALHFAFKCKWGHGLLMMHTSILELMYMYTCTCIDVISHTLMNV